MKDNNKTNYTNVTLNSTSRGCKAEPYPFSASAVIQSLFKFNKLSNGETCLGLLRRFVHKIINNNEISPHNDMKDNILNLVQDDNAVVAQNDVINKNVKNLFPYFHISLSINKKLRRFRIISWIIGGSAGSTQPSPGRATLSFRSCQNPQSGMTFIKQPAFTLAETLITLGIIGIVAAMTIPNLITSANQKATVSRLIEAQSILNQAVKSYTADSDEEGSADFDTSLEPKEFAEKYFKPYLKVARVCTKMEDGCWKTGNFYGYYDLAGNKVTDVAPYSLVLNNGMIIGFSKIFGTKLYAIVVDVDGHSNRNVMGRDVHSFYPYNRDNLCSYDFEKWKNLKNGLYPGGFDNCGAPHLAYSREELLEGKVLRPCNKNKANVGGGGRTGVGSACAAVIFKDGWKISKDYPW